MSALDDAIADHLAHAAGAVGDPLTEALQMQADAAARTHQAPGDESWDRTDAAVPVPAWALGIALAASLALASLVSFNASRSASYAAVSASASGSASGGQR